MRNVFEKFGDFIEDHDAAITAAALCYVWMATVMPVSLKTKQKLFLNAWAILIGLKLGGRLDAVYRKVHYPYGRR